MLTESQANRLTRIARYRTKYELTMSDGTRSFLVAYSEGRARRDIMKCIQADHRLPQILSLIGSETEITFAKRAVDGAVIGPWKIRWSGRTQRECILSGELPYVGDVTI